MVVAKRNASRKWPQSEINSDAQLRRNCAVQRIDHGGSSSYSWAVFSEPAGFYLWERLYTNEWHILRSACLHIHTREMSIRCKMQRFKPQKKCQKARSDLCVCVMCVVGSIVHLKWICDHFLFDSNQTLALQTWQRNTDITQINRPHFKIYPGFF